MEYFFKCLFFLLNINQEIALRDFGTENPTTTWAKMQNGFTLKELENVIFFILFIRFVILVFRYNLKTSFYITCIGIAAGSFWFRHLIDLVSLYRNTLINVPFFYKMGINAFEERFVGEQRAPTDLKVSKNPPSNWYNLGQTFYYALTKGITHIDKDTGAKYYIDPISMIISNLPEVTKTNILPVYYQIYNSLIPQIFEICYKFYNQISGIATYILITRLGKKYCPYLIRWHWTLLLSITIFEPILSQLVYRASYFQMIVLIPQLQEVINTNNNNANLNFQIELLNLSIIWIVFINLSFVIFALFHAICGQYFYLPFFVENTELHVGPRPADSIYSGGQTAWQNRKEKTVKGFFPKLWYGWFGRGVKNERNLGFILKLLVQKLKKLLAKIL